MTGIPAKDNLRLWFVLYRNILLKPLLLGVLVSATEYKS